MRVPPTIKCVDCDGVAHLLTPPTPDVPLEPGSTLSYRCDSCWERFDIVWEDQDYAD